MERVRAVMGSNDVIHHVALVLAAFYIARVTLVDLGAPIRMPAPDTRFEMGIIAFAIAYSVLKNSVLSTLIAVILVMNAEETENRRDP